MTHWLDTVDSQLRRVAREHVGAFEGLQIAHSLRDALKPFPESSLRNAATLQVARTLARCALVDMVGEIAEAGPHLRSTTLLLSVIRRWDSADKQSNDLLFGNLRATSVNFAIEDSLEGRPKESGLVFWMAATLLQQTFPVTYKADSQMLSVVVHFACIAYVHQKVCSPEKHRRVMDALVADLKNIRA